MSEWHTETPYWDEADNSIPVKQQPKWYMVKLVDGTECQACWWLGCWYCFSEPYNIVAWREL